MPTRILLAIFTSLLLPGAATNAATPNIVLCMADDLGWGDVGFNGNEVIQTPHLDAMAAGGLTFNRFYSAAPVCSPTRGSCLTGRHPFRYGIPGANSGHMKRPEFTLPELLKEHGYATGHFGKWHLGTLTTTEQDSNRGGPKNKQHFSIPTQHGYDTYFCTEAKVPTWDPMIRPRGNNSRTWWDPVADSSEGTYYGTAYWSESGKGTDDLSGDDSKVIMDRVLPFIRSATESEQPFFAVVWFHAPHLPVVAGPEYTRLYAKHDKHSQHYFGCITALDEQMGRLRNELRDLGVADNTLVTFCSDNGPEGNDKSPGSAGPFRGRKRSLFEGGVRVPGVMEWPSVIKAGRSTAVAAVTSDYLPTVVDILGHQSNLPVQPIDGVSLLPLLKGERFERTSPIGFQSSGQVTLVEHQYKLVRVTDSRKGKRKQETKDNPKWMLFDLLSDPSESTDIASEHPDVVERMAKTVTEWQTSCRRSDVGEDYE